MTPTPVGMRCPECARERTKVNTLRTMPSTPIVTQALIAINVAVFFAETAAGAPLGGGGGGQVWDKGYLLGSAISQQHQYWRIVSSGFMHDGLAHLFINMLSLYFVGRVLEPAVGSRNFAVIYFVSLLAGSFGALLFQPQVATVGASGAIFGIFGALLVVARARRIPIWQSGLGFVLLINLLLSVSFRDISIGGHLGGLVGGLIMGWLVVELDERRRWPAAAIAGCALLAAVSVVGALAVAGSHGIAPNGIGFTG
jgi:membrane associated rhomboid family serine protease